jgi:tetratricopeptide (TPR) repeat protein
MQALDRLQETYASRGFQVLAIEGEGSTVEQVLDRVGKMRAIGVLQRYIIVPDPGGRIARQFGIEGTPQIILLDGAGRVSRHFEGFRAGDEAALETGVKELLGIAPPAPTRAERTTVPEVPPAAAPASPPEPEDPTRALLEKYRYFGTYHLSRGEPAKAEEYFRKLVALEPGNVESWMRIGEACARQGRYDQAREAWETVQRIDPGNPEADANIRRLIRGEY